VGRSWGGTGRATASVQPITSSCRASRGIGRTKSTAPVAIAFLGACRDTSRYPGPAPRSCHLLASQPARLPRRRQPCRRGPRPPHGSCDRGRGNRVTNRWEVMAGRWTGFELENALLYRHVLRRRRDVDNIGGHSISPVASITAIGVLEESSSGSRLSWLGSRCLHEDERHASIGWQMEEELTECLQSSGRRADANDSEGRNGRLWRAESGAPTDGTFWHSGLRAHAPRWHRAEETRIAATPPK